MCLRKRVTSSKRRAGHQRRLRAARPFAQAQHQSRDDAERALRADEQLLHVVSRVVLEHAVHGRDHGAVGQHGFEAQHRIARHAIADHAVAARIGGDAAADLRRTPRAQVHRIEQAVLFRFVLHALQRHAGFDRHRAPDRIDGFDAMHALERQRDFVRARHAALHQSREAAERYDRLPRCMAGREHARHFAPCLRAARSRARGTDCDRPSSRLRADTSAPVSTLAGPTMSSQCVEQ